MPVVCTKAQNNCFETVTSRVLERKKEDKEYDFLNQTLKTFSVNLPNLDVEKYPTTFFTGTAIPNSTIKKRLTVNRNNDVDLDINITVRTSSELLQRRSKEVQTEAVIIQEINKNESEKKSQKNPSIVSGSPKIQELQELQKQLSKNYEPKPLFEPRRPTLESIKSAIEKAKQDEARRNKNVNTEESNSVVSTSDASTSTLKKYLKKKKHKIKKKSEAFVTTSVATSILVASSSTSAAASGCTFTKAKKRASKKGKKKIHIEKKLSAHLEKS